MKRILGLYLVLGGMALAACNNDAMIVPSHNNTNGPQHHQIEEIIPLRRVEVINDQKVAIIDNLSGAVILKEKRVAGGKVTLYTKREDDENIYGLFQTDDTQYDLGIVGGQNPALDDEILSVTELPLFNKILIRIKGLFGANAPVQNYFLNDDGIIKPFLRIDTGHAIEVDLDADGHVEIVATHGMPNQTYIYEWREGKFLLTDVNEMLAATSVFYNDDNKMFEAYYGESDTTEFLKYSSKGLVRHAY